MFDSGARDEAMLVIELLPGLKFINGMRAYYKQGATENAITLKQMETMAQ